MILTTLPAKVHNVRTAFIHVVSLNTSMCTDLLPYFANYQPKQLKKTSLLKGNLCLVISVAFVGF